jgi:hypothetical protein
MRHKKKGALADALKFIAEHSAGDLAARDLAAMILILKDSLFKGAALIMTGLHLCLARNILHAMTQAK